MAKKIWEIPVIWECYGKIEVSAHTLEEAIDLALTDAPLPTESTYVDGSCKVDEDNADNWQAPTGVEED